VTGGTTGRDAEPEVPTTEVPVMEAPAADAAKIRNEAEISHQPEV
jgi:hypothetical protein